ncbi:MAG: hypothetical protein Mars2KO_39480 [Maribacter sp.]
MQKRVFTYHYAILVLIAIGLIFSACTEPFSPELLPEAESILVVDATLTNEIKHHEVLLSRSSQEQGKLQIEPNATVRITDDTQQTFTFSETEPGTYISDVAFGATANGRYRLQITTSDGKAYTSNAEPLPPIGQIDTISTERTLTTTGSEGVSITLDSFDPTGSSRFYRYEYEETYKIIAPKWGPDQLVVLSEENQAVGIINRDPEKEERTCYATDNSISLILTKTSGAGDDRVSDFEVRFLNRNNFIISHRYSILVKQFILSQQAYTFYEKLKDFSGSESLFSQSQPGFINGNIFPDDDSGERVVGIFEVASVSEKRAFFNYSDFFPDEELPPFIDECRPNTFQVGGNPSVFEFVRSNRVSYTNSITDPNTGSLQAYIVVPRVCGDCTVIGNSEVPDFWEE